MRYGRNYGESRYGNNYNDGTYVGVGRGHDTKYRGEDILNDMEQNYGNYSESRNAYGNGNYGAKRDTMKSLDYMLQSMVDFVQMLSQEASSREETELIKEYLRKANEVV